MSAPTFADVAAAAARIASHSYRTPVLRSDAADARVGARVFFKCENLQRAGAFKFRGAFNTLSKLSDQQRAAGVVAFSSGNHAQAVALAAQILNIPAVIVMPSDAPVSKLDATREYGAEIILYDRYAEDRRQIAARLANERGMTLTPPFDHADIIAGQGTAAKELFEEVGPLDSLFTPLGGGGLLSGSALAARALSPACRVYGAEPAAGDDGKRSLESGRIVNIDVPRTIADGAQTQQLGDLTFEIIRREVSDVFTAGDGELVDAMKFFAERMKLMIEPTGCLGYAAAISATTDAKGQRVGVILSGGNIATDRFTELLAQFKQRQA